MKICIVSDSHDRGQMLAAAVTEARDNGAEAVIHCGDIIGGNTLRATLKLDLPLHVVHGNNVGDQVALARLASDSGGWLNYYGQDAAIELGGRRIFITHYPHLGHAMACTGDYDLVCYGHSHEALVVQQDNLYGGKTWLVNPGTVAGLGALAATWILGDLNDMRFEILTLSRCAAS
ncbi:MAG: metallophosphoesterase family protein [Sterolibacterium sp.]